MRNKTVRLGVREKKFEMHAETDLCYRHFKADSPGFRGFLGGVTHIDIFKTTDPIDLKFFCENFNTFLVPKKIFVTPRIF